MAVNGLYNIVRESSFAIHKYLKSEHWEKVYENALVYRYKKAGPGCKTTISLKSL